MKLIERSGARTVQRLGEMVFCLADLDDAVNALRYRSIAESPDRVEGHLAKLQMFGIVEIFALDKYLTPRA